MPDHKELIEECVQAFGQAWHATPEGVPGDRRRAGIAAIEPLIRADERREAQLDLEAGIVYRELIKDDVLADLRAKVAAMQGGIYENWVRRSDVLALIDGAL